MCNLWIWCCIVNNDIHKNPPLVPVLNQIKSVQVTHSIYLISILILPPSSPRPPEWPSLHFPSVSFLLHILFYIVLLNLITQIWLGEGYDFEIYDMIYDTWYDVIWPPLWSSGQSFWLQIQRSRVRSPALPNFLSSSGSGTGSTQPREVNWGATWMKKIAAPGLENKD